VVPAPASARDSHSAPFIDPCSLNFGFLPQVRLGQRFVVRELAQLFRKAGPARKAEALQQPYAGAAMSHRYKEAPKARREGRTIAMQPIPSQAR
jgi:hypothetical protein